MHHSIPQAHSEHTATMTVMAERKARAPERDSAGLSSDSPEAKRSLCVFSWKVR